MKLVIIAKNKRKKNVYLQYEDTGILPLRPFQDLVPLVAAELGVLLPGDACLPLDVDRGRVETLLRHQVV